MNDHNRRPEVERPETKSSKIVMIICYNFNFPFLAVNNQSKQRLPHTKPCILPVQIPFRHFAWSKAKRQPKVALVLLLLLLLLH